MQNSTHDIEPWDAPFVLESNNRRQEKGCLPARDDSDLFDAKNEPLF